MSAPSRKTRVNSWEKRSRSCLTRFLLQRQFEFANQGFLSVESHLHQLCDAFRIRKAVLSNGLFCLEIRSRPPEMVQIRFQADHTTFKQLGRVLKTMLPALIIRPN